MHYVLVNVTISEKLYNLYTLHGICIYFSSIPKIVKNNPEHSEVNVNEMS